MKTNEMAYRHLKEETDRKLLKFNQVSERLAVISEEKEKCKEEVDKHKDKCEKLEKELLLKEH